MRWFLGTLVALLVGAVVYVGSAIVSLDRLVDAAKAGDGAGVLARTDTARLRRSLVDQIVAAYLKRLGQDRPVKPLERLAANTYGASIADAMIAKMLTAENLTSILNKGAINAGGGVASMQRLTEIRPSNVLETLGRISPVKPVELLIRLGDSDTAGGIAIHFEGDRWKLSGILLPNAAVQVLAQDLVNSRGRTG